MVTVISQVLIMTTHYMSKVLTFHNLFPVRYLIEPHKDIMKDAKAGIIIVFYR